MRTPGGYVKKIFFVSFLFLVGFGNASFARLTSDAITIGDLSYGGTGCPDGTAIVMRDAEGKLTDVMFTDFSAAVGAGYSRRMDRKTCSIAIPIHVPAGVSVRANFSHILGYYNVTKNNSAQFSIETFFAGSIGPRLNMRVQSENEEATYDFSTQMPPSMWTWSPCGQDVILRVNMTLMANATTNFGRALINVDQFIPGGDDGELVVARSCEQ